MDSLWTVPPVEIGTFQTGDGGVMIMPIPFAPTSGFGVSGNGLMWRILGYPARVETKRAFDAETSGPVWTRKPTPVAAQDRDSVIAEFRAGRWPNVHLEFAHYKPLFDEVLIAPWGEAWVHMLDHPGRNTYQLFDSLGRSTGSIQFKTGSKAIGFGDGEAYLIRGDSSGFETLFQVALTQLLRQDIP